MSQAAGSTVKETRKGVVEAGSPLGGRLAAQPSECGQPVRTCCLPGAASVWALSSWTAEARRRWRLRTPGGSQAPELPHTLPLLPPASPASTLLSALVSLPLKLLAS